MGWFSDRKRKKVIWKMTDRFEIKGILPYLRDSDEKTRKEAAASLNGIVCGEATFITMISKWKMDGKSMDYQSMADVLGMMGSSLSNPHGLKNIAEGLDDCINGFANSLNDNYEPVRLHSAIGLGEIMSRYSIGGLKHQKHNHIHKLLIEALDYNDLETQVAVSLALVNMGDIRRANILVKGLNLSYFRNSPGLAESLLEGFTWAVGEKFKFDNLTIRKIIDFTYDRGGILGNSNELEDNLVKFISHCGKRGENAYLKYQKKVAS